MPLSTGTSAKARQENIKKEIEAGKPPEQAAAIAYSQQRRNVAKKAARARDCPETLRVLGELKKLLGL